MKFTRLAYLIRNRDRTLAIFGKARLVKNTAGRVELHGGTLDDRRAAREWCSLFLHEATIDLRAPSSVVVRGPSSVPQPSTLNPQPSTLSHPTAAINVAPISTLPAPCTALPAPPSAEPATFTLQPSTPTPPALAA